MRNSDKFKKTIDDEQLDEVAGGFMMPENPASSQIPAHIIEKIRNNPEGSISDLDLPNNLSNKKISDIEIKDKNILGDTKFY